jgi:D-serine deaminase-like pyridoxal phosphate-dependent protein
MAAKANKSGVRFRPHFKTHRSAAVGEWYRSLGVDTITVSSVDMAVYFSGHGWRDITIAFPANVLEIDKINGLAGEIELGLLVESLETARFLETHLEARAHGWIKVDIGYGRTGIPWDRPGAVIELAKELERAASLEFRGLLTHAGHSYDVTSKPAIESIHRESVLRLQRVKRALQEAGIAECELSIGDTPTCSTVDDLSGVDEVRPGNFVFYDLKQVRIGSCCEEDIAVAIACPVVAKHPERREIVLYGGAVHLSKDSFANADGSPVFGRVSLWEGERWGPSLRDTYVSSLSQEHGIVKTTAEVVDQAHVGDILIVLPVHSCLLSYLLEDFHALDGEILLSQSSAGAPA